VYEKSLDKPTELVTITKVTNSARADFAASSRPSTSDAPAAPVSTIADTEKNAGVSKRESVTTDAQRGAECPRCGKLYGEDIIFDRLARTERTMPIDIVIHRWPGGCGEVVGVMEFRMWNEPRWDMKNVIASGQNSGRKWWDKLKYALVMRLFKIRE
jgi:hypothetical protein